MNKLCIAEMVDNDAELSCDRFGAYVGCECADCNSIRRKKMQKLDEINAGITQKHKIDKASEEMYDMIKRFASIQNYDVNKFEHTIRMCRDFVAKIEN